MDQEELEEVARAIRSVGTAITADAQPSPDAVGGSVSSLTEAVMGMTAGLIEVAEALNNIADSISERK